MANFDLNKIQSILKDMNIDAWLFYDFRRSNDLAHEILDISPNAHFTRRFYYFVPQSGEPVKIINGIEAFNLDHLPGKKLMYSSRTSLADHLKETLSGAKKIAMEYSPMNAIPYVAKADAGTIEFVKSFGVEIVSSADLISMFGARWTMEQYEENRPVANAVHEIAHEAFDYIAENFRAGKTLNEYQVQQFILEQFDKRGYFTDHPPIVGVNENGANPHYEPTAEVNKEIKEGDFVLIDLWAKPNHERGTWSDITWTGYMGSEVPEKYIKVANIVFEARDKAFNLIKERFADGKEVRGYEADRIARDHIKSHHYGEYFIHRTGHSITTELHGSGAHLDDFETKDERLLLPLTSFSIEPGIYIKGDFGVRSEIDVFVTEDGDVIATGGERQYEIIPILK